MVTTEAKNHTRFTYGQATVADLRVRKVERTQSGRVTLKDLTIDGQSVTATKRFWRSFFSRFGIAENVFRYFAPDEVFKRISAMSPDDSFRYCISKQASDEKSGGRSKNRLWRSLI
jgi:hypothetical protein